ncbi:unnamed protein product, partial [Mesorhabditis spiculigera]
MWCTTFVSLNRLTTVLFPFSYERLWKKMYPIAVLVTVFLPVCFMWHLLVSPVKFVVTNGALSFDYVRTVTWLPNSLLSAINGLLTGGFQMVFYYTLYIAVNFDYFARLYAVRPLFWDLLTLSPPWTLLILSTDIRTRIFTHM